MSYFYWWYIIEPKYLWQAVIITTRRVFYTFSIPQLLSTLFAPWKKDVSYKENPSLSESFQIFINNLISRLIGALVRFFTIIGGIIITTITFIFCLSLFLIWILLPLIIVYLLYLGVNNLNA